MKFAQMVQGKFLRKEDIDEDVIVTIQGFKEVNVAPQDQPQEMKWTVKFHEYDKPLVLNQTNQVAIQNATRVDSTEEAIGKEVVLFVDPNVSYAGKVIGGLRIRANRAAKAPARATPRKLVSEEDMGDASSYGDETAPF